MHRAGRLLLTLPIAATLTAFGIPTAALAQSPSISPHVVSPPTRLTLTSVSEPRAQLVSGDQVLLRVSLPAGDSASQVVVTRNGTPVTAAFVPQPDGTLLGLVTGLTTGQNSLVASIPATTSSGGQTSTLTVTDHPSSGPVFSGPQQTPFYCETTAYGLAAATQPTCSAPTQVSYEYKSTTTGGFKPIADPTSRPTDLASALVNGQSVPYVIRLEQGTIDRAVYQIAALYDGNAPVPTSLDKSWNQRLVYTFGGGCNGGYHQGNSTGGVLNDLFLSQGYAVASSSLNVLDNNCSTVISAEAAQMVKEHFIDTYGPVVHTIGWGGSGGAIQQYGIADQYPGILDGIIPGISFPDPYTTTGPVTDCELLENFVTNNPNALTAAQEQAVAGFRDFTTCSSWLYTFANRTTATGSCNNGLVGADAVIPATVAGDPTTQYNATTNPNGVKCGALEQVVNQFGRKADGFVNSTFDNTGEQYGLAAVRAGSASTPPAGSLTPAQFDQLNAAIGGINDAGAIVAQRSVADAPALAAAYADDLLVNGGQGLRTTPIIDQREDLDLAGFGNDIHTSDWSFVMRARLQQANGTAGNQVIIDNAPDATTEANASAYELSAMNSWLDNISADTSSASAQTKTLSDKPGDLGDGCYTSAATRILDPLSDPVTAGSTCGAAFPVAANTRTSAGQPLDLKVLKCQLIPATIVNGKFDGVTWTDSQANLTAAFPDGVCDYTQPGVGQSAPTSAWLSYGDSAVGSPTAPTPALLSAATSATTAPLPAPPVPAPPVTTPPAPPVVAPAVVTVTVPRSFSYGTATAIRGTVSRGGVAQLGTPVVVTDRYADGSRGTLGTAVTNVAGAWTLKVTPARNGTITATTAGASATARSTVAVSYRAVTVAVTGKTVTVKAQIRPGLTITRSRSEQAQLLLVNASGRVLRVLATVRAAQRVSVPHESHGVNVVIFTVRGLAAGGSRLEVRTLATSLNAGASSRQFTVRVA